MKPTYTAATSGQWSPAFQSKLVLLNFGGLIISPGNLHGKQSSTKLCMRLQYTRTHARTHTCTHAHTHTHMYVHASPHTTHSWAHHCRSCAGVLFTTICQRLRVIQQKQVLRYPNVFSYTCTTRTFKNQFVHTCMRMLCALCTRTYARDVRKIWPPTDSINYTVDSDVWGIGKPCMCSPCLDSTPHGDS